MNEFRFHPYRVRHQYADPIDQERARLLLAIGVIIFVVSVAVLALMLVRATESLVAVVAVLTPVWAVAVLNVFLVQSGRLRVASILFMAMFLLGAAVNLYSFGTGATTLLPIALSLVLGVTLLGVRGGVLVFAAGSALVVLTAIAQDQGAIARIIEPVGEVAYSLALLLTTLIVLALSVGRLEATLRRATDVSARLRATRAVGQIIATRQSLEALLRDAAALLRQHFGFCHVNLFLIDEDSARAVLHASAGRAGRRLLAQGHHLELDSRTVVGRAALVNEPVVADHTDPLFTADPLLSNARAEFAAPLRVADRVIGVLEVYSTNPDAFSDDEVPNLLALAEQLAVAVENTRLFEATQRALAEKAGQLDNALARVREVERQNQQLTGEAWARYLGHRGVDTLGFDWQNGALHKAGAWSPGMIAATSEQRASLRQEGDRQVLTVPIVLRGRALGAVELANSEGENWSDDAIELAQAVVNRLELSLETARLTEDAQRLAERERLVSAVSAELQGTQDMADVLQLAAAEIRRALSAHTTTVRLASDNAGNGHEARPA
ncbi:MAG: hypothetical protein Kow00120_00160 [Anaerolineae bacterium]